MTGKPLQFGLFRLGKGLPSPLDLGPEESARLGRIAAPLRAAQYLAGRWLLRKLCALAADAPMDAIALNAEGAPRALGPAGIALPRLSLSHSGDWVAGAACFGPCGVDLERRGARRDWGGLAQRMGLQESVGEAGVLKAWTLAEARIKAGGGEGQAPALAVWRFESPVYAGCLLAPAGVRPEPHIFDGSGASDAGFRLEASPD
ncbi:MAG TPA: hypothetical protein VK914_08565 [bacterium]|jgi:hypothetical protein|nr:hypothetical protein [bacterium]